MNARAMDHEEAIKNLTAERYLLGELSVGERDAYEEHLFTCAVCLEHVKTGTEFVSHLRRIGPDEPPPTPARGVIPKLITNFRQPAAITAFALFLFVAGIAVHQNSVISRLKEPRPQLRFVLTGITHGSSATNVVQATRDSGLSLNVEYQRKGEFISYHADILSGSGKIMHTVSLPENQVGTMASIAMPAEALEPGQYSIVVSGRRSDGSLEEVGRGVFELQFTSN
jgi:hypothetical protein